MSILIDTADSDRAADEDLPGRAVAEIRFRQASVRLERALAERTEAACHFLEARAAWTRAASPDQSDLFLDPPGAHVGECPVDMLEEAELQVRQLKALFCAALEQRCLQQQMLGHLRSAYQRAQENLDRLAIKG